GQRGQQHAPALLVGLAQRPRIQQPQLGQQRQREAMLGAPIRPLARQRRQHLLALSLLTELRLLDAGPLGDPDDDDDRGVLTELAERCERDLSEISDRIARSFFAHAEQPVALVHAGRADRPEVE
ncbi:MAG: hypothetical protein AAFV86_21530, partial [Pseudomonadota bacterium]